MYKAGDKFEVVSGGELYGVSRGDIVEFQQAICESVAQFKTSSQVFLAASTNGKNSALSVTVRPVRTEAEKRGAKFGVTGVIKGSKIKISFISDAVEKNILGENLWYVCHEDGTTGYYHPSNIRLDHEPEYKEIPFSEATHEQRMDDNNLYYRDSPVVQISHFPGWGYAFTVAGSFDIHTDASNLTIRIPA